MTGSAFPFSFSSLHAYSACCTAPRCSSVFVVQLAIIASVLVFLVSLLFFLSRLSIFYMRIGYLSLSPDIVHLSRKAMLCPSCKADIENTDEGRSAIRASFSDIKSSLYRSREPLSQRAPTRRRKPKKEQSETQVPIGAAPVPGVNFKLFSVEWI